MEKQYYNCLVVQPNIAMGWNAVPGSHVTIKCARDYSIILCQKKPIENLSMESYYKHSDF